MEWNKGQMVYFRIGFGYGFALTDANSREFQETIQFVRNINATLFDTNICSIVVQKPHSRAVNRNMMPLNYA